MKYVRMPIEIESPEEQGYDTIRFNLSESSMRGPLVTGSVAFDPSRVVQPFRGFVADLEVLFVHLWLAVETGMGQGGRFGLGSRQLWRLPSTRAGCALPERTPCAITVA